MLNVMRDNLRHLKWVLVLVALAMLGYLGSYFDPRVKSGGQSSEWAARVDGQSISTQEFLQIARTQDDYYRQLLGAQYEQMKKNLKLGSQAIQSLVDRQLVLEEARSLGLSATKDAISKAILGNPNFKDPSGNFVGRDRYSDYIGQNYDGGVEAYERRLGDDILTKQWIEVMTASARISDAEIEQAFRSRSVRAAVDYVFVPASPAPLDASVDAATLSAWYASHPNDYKRPEARKVRFAVIDRQSQIANAKVSDADVKSDYDAHTAEYTRAAGVTPLAEVRDAIRRRLELERAQNLAAAVAERLAGQIKKAEDLDAVATKAGLKIEERVISSDDPAADLGPSPEFTSAVLSMSKGQTSSPLGLARGLAIVACTEILPPMVRPFAEVASQVKNDVLSEQGRQAAYLTARRIAASLTLAEGAKPVKLDVKKSGDLGAGVELPGVGRVPELDAVLFGASGVIGAKGAVAATGGALAYEITRHDAFDPSKFEAEKATLRQELLQRRRDQLAQGLIENLRKQHTIEINQPLVDSVNG